MAGNHIEKRRSRLVRAAAASAAVAGPLLVWAAARAAGHPLRGVRRRGLPVVLDLSDVLTVSLVAVLVGWLSLAVLERLTRHAALIWTIAASGTTVLLAAHTVTGQLLSGGERALLVVRLLVLAGALIPAFAWTSARATHRRRQ